ncbi:MAG: ABC transporter ATP-binding protein [Chloroflexota bacterium]
MLELIDVSRCYGEGTGRVVALDSIDLNVADGAFLAVMGPSGSGKSTLLNVMGGVDRVTSGEVRFDGERIDSISEDELVQYRRGRLAYVFQQYHLIQSLTVFENVALPLAFRGESDNGEAALEMLERVGLAYRAHHRPSELSGGEQQRVAIARALVTAPSLILADEPTGNLDQESGRKVMELLVGLNREGKSIVLVTHNPEVAVYATEVLTLRDGRVVSRAQSAMTLAGAKTAHAGTGGDM